MKGLILEKLTVSSSAPDLLCTQSYSLFCEMVLKTKVVTTNLDARLEVQGESSSNQVGFDKLEICV